MGKNEKYGKYGVKNHSQHEEARPIQFQKKKRSRIGIKMVLAFALIAIVFGAVGYSLLQPQSDSLPNNNPSQTTQTYPRNAALVTYTAPVLSADALK